MVDVVYQTWDVFGQPPSQNFRYNWMPGDSQIPTTPYFASGIYQQYYCLLSDNSLYAGTPILGE